jgi:hypothetical protein
MLKQLLFLLPPVQGMHHDPAVVAAAAAAAAGASKKTQTNSPHCCAVEICSATLLLPCCCCCRHQRRKSPLTALLWSGNLLCWPLHVCNVGECDAPLERRRPEVNCTQPAHSASAQSKHESKKREQYRQLQYKGMVWCVNCNLKPAPAMLARAAGKCAVASMPVTQLMLF